MSETSVLEVASLDGHHNTEGVEIKCSDNKAVFVLVLEMEPSALVQEFDGYAGTEDFDELIREIKSSIEFCTLDIDIVASRLYVPDHTVTTTENYSSYVKDYSDDK